jgi:hypothetical protein
MPGPSWWTVPLALPGSVAALLGGLLGYVGLGPGQELIPQFLALLWWMGAALLAVLQWPLLVLLRRFQGKAREQPKAEPEQVPAKDTPSPPSP